MIEIYQEKGSHLQDLELITWSPQPAPMTTGPYIAIKFPLLLTGFCLGLIAHLSAEPVSFSDEVQPILSENCFHCHGPDAAERKADLRLDLHPGAAMMEEVLARVSTTDLDDRMPPSNSNRSLTTDQIAKLTQWVEQGAPYEKHWAFEKPRRPNPPRNLSRPDWVRNPIDRFVLRRLDAEGLTPAPEADPRTLVRRLYLDLTGLPPTPQQIQDYLAVQDQPQAYLELVNGLLDSPHYGEQMALPDAAR